VQCTEWNTRSSIEKSMPNRAINADARQRGFARAAVACYLPRLGGKKRTSVECVQTPR